MISYKIENLPEKQRRVVDDWANSQENIQQSLTNIIMHTVAFVGNEDVMDFEVQRKLHMLLSNSSLPATQNNEQKTVVVEKQEIAPTPIVETKKNENDDDPLSKATGLFDDD